MAGRPGVLDHPTGVGALPAGAIHDHLKPATLQLGQGRVVVAIAHQRLDVGGQGVLAPGEEGEVMAGRQQVRHQRPAHEAGAAHHQNLHARVPRGVLARPFNLAAAPDRHRFQGRTVGDR